MHKDHKDNTKRQTIGSDALREAQTTLDAITGRHTNLYDFSPVGYCTLDETGLILEANQAIARLFGTNREALSKLPLSRFIAKNDHEIFFRHRKLLLGSGKAQDFELQMLMHDGSPFCAHLISSATRDPDGSPVIHVVLSDISEHKRAEANLHRNEAFYLTILDSISAEIAVLDRNGIVIAGNQPWRHLAFKKGILPGDLAPHIKLGANFMEACRKLDQLTLAGSSSIIEGLQSVMSGQQAFFSIEYLCSTTRKRWFNMRITPMGDGAVITNTDITTVKQAELHEQFQQRILERLAQDEPLVSLFEALVLGLEQLNPTMLCSILLLDQGGRHLGQGIAPSLPDFYNAAINGVEIGPAVGSCGTAAYTGARVVVEDITTHPYWAPYKALAARAGLAACWSQPILAASGKVLGTFAIYHHEPQAPTDADIYIIEQAARLASIAIDRHMAIDKLRDNEERWQFALEGSGEGVWDWNIETGESLYSKRWKQMFGFADDEIGNTSSEWSSRVHPDDLPKVMLAIQAHIDGEAPSIATEYRMRCKDGSWLWTIGRGMVVSRSVDGGALRLVGTNTDISERKRIEEALFEEKEFFHLIAESIEDYIAVLDLEGRRLYNSPAYMALFGTNRDLTGSDSFAEIHPDDRDKVKRVFQETIRTGKGQMMNYRFLTEDGRMRHMESLGSVIRNSAGRIERVVVVSRDITERKQMEDEVRHLAFYDTLTDLPNRRLLNDRLTQSMAASVRSACYGAALFLDLDNFKPLNDLHGHDAGDLLLIEVAGRLKRCVREIDTVARFGGDELVVVIGDLHADKTESKVQARFIAEKIRRALSEPYLLTLKRNTATETKIEHRCTVSIGVVLFINHEATHGDILKWADMAMYKAKEAGRNQIRFFDVTTKQFE